MSPQFLWKWKGETKGIWEMQVLWFWWLHSLFSAGPPPVATTAALCSAVTRGVKALALPWAAQHQQSCSLLPPKEKQVRFWRWFSSGERGIAYVVDVGLFRADVFAVFLTASDQNKSFSVSTFLPVVVDNIQWHFPRIFFILLFC